MMMDQEVLFLVNFIKSIMDQIELFGKDQKPADSGEKKLENKSNKFESKRPEELEVSKPKIHPGSRRWRECKIIGKNIEIRSYSASCGFKGKLYVYGGYQILKGNMGDFYSIDLDDSVAKFCWEPVEAKGQLPGNRSKHALLASKDRIFLIGGLCTDIFSSNKIHCFNPETSEWKLMQPAGEQLPQIDSFGAVYLEKDGEERIVILCGWDGSKAEYLNTVYEYNITKNHVSLLFEGSKGEQKDAPLPRSGCAAATDGKVIYVFGGKDAENRMNDTWEFNLTDFKFKELPKEGDIPPERNGHTVEYFEGKLFVFGGIHDITWELDDLHIYNLDKKVWTTLEQDSPRKIEKKKKVNDDSPTSQEKREKKSPKRKNWFDGNNTLYPNKTSINDNSPMRRNYQTTYNKDDDETASPGKMIDEQRKKAFLQRKNEMLRNFEVGGDEAKNYVKFETVSQAMRNSLDVIGNPDPKQKVYEGRLTEFGKESHSKFLEPLENNSNLIIGKKPCARDGHNSVLLNGELVIFGGDRHQMSFSDIYKMNFKGE